MWTLPHMALIASVVVYCIATHGPVWLPAWLCAALPHAACAGVASYGRSLSEEIVGCPRTSPPVFLYDAQCHGTPEPHLIATRGPVSGCQCCGVLYCHTRLVYCIATHSPVSVLPAWLCAALPHAACAGVDSYGRSLSEGIVGSPRASSPVLLHDAQCHGTPEPHLIASVVVCSIATRGLCLVASVVDCIATCGLC